MEIELSKPFAANSKVDEYDTRQIKKALNRLGYYFPYEKVGITGIPDNETFTALKSFQQDYDLEPTGTTKPGDKTVNALNTAIAKPQKGQYIWHTVHDSRVRKSHAALDGEVRDWNDSPMPGEEPGCRCWAEPVATTIPKNSCDEERKTYEEAKKRVKNLSKKFNDLLLRLDELKEEHNKLLENTRKSLGAQAVAYILTLPFDRIGHLTELLRRYFGNIISNKLLEAATNFMRQVLSVKQRIQYTKDQIALVLAQLEKAAEELEQTKKKLEECEDNATESH